MRKLIFLILLISAETLFGQEPHQKEALHIEELLEKNNPNLYKTIQRGGNYLVLDNYRNQKRRRYYVGDMLGFRTESGQFFQEELSEIGDSTLTVMHYNNVERKLETWVIKLADIKKVYRREVYKRIKWGLGWGTLAAFVPIFYDWVQFGRSPAENTEALIMIPAIQAGSILIANRSKFFNGIKLNGNIQLKIFKSL
jgi:hypothetical protein